MADVKISALTAAGSAAGANEIPINEAGTTKKVTVTQIITYAKSLGFPIVKTSTADLALTSTTAAKYTNMDQTIAAADVGTYRFEYWMRYQSTTATVGVKWDVNYSGTNGFFVLSLRYTASGAAASLGTASMAAAGATGQVYEAFGRRAKGTAGFGTTVSSDTTGDMFTIIEGLASITGTGDFQLYAGLETGTSGVSLMTGSSLILTRVA